MFSLTLVGDRELILKAERLVGGDLRRSVLRKVTALTFRLQALVKRKLTNDVLNVRTGALRDSIFREVLDSGNAIVGRVASSGNVKYAAIHEFGGVTPPHVIEPKNADVLAFVMNGRQVFARYVNHPGSRMPERSFMRSSLREMQPMIRAGLTEAVMTPLRKPAR